MFTSNVKFCVDSLTAHVRCCKLNGWKAAGGDYKELFGLPIYFPNMPGGRLTLPDLTQNM